MSEDKTAYVRVVELEQEVIKLKELNSDMYNALESVCPVVCKVGMDCDDCGLGHIELVLHKVRGEEEYANFKP